MSYVYIQTEQPCRDNDWNALYTVGFYNPAGEWISESDYQYKDQAAARVAYLNGTKEERAV